MFCDLIALAQTVFYSPNTSPPPPPVFQGNRIKKKSCDIVIGILPSGLQEALS